MSTLHYLAYGSNLHPLRLRERVPSASLLGRVYLSGQSVVFHKISPDGSSKCDLVEAGPRALAFGALYAIDHRHLPVLDAYEGRGSGYDRIRLPLPFRGHQLHGFTYRAAPTHINPSLKPFCWYLDLVLAGADFLDLPASYRQALAVAATQQDLDLTRRSRHTELLTRMRRYRGCAETATIRA